MEKLQPVLRQIFWILFGLGLILILWAWYSASNKLSADIASEEAKVSATKKGAAKTVLGLPNPNWTAEANKLNQEHEQAFDESAEKLREQQLTARVYPKRIRHELKQLEFRSKIADASVRGIFAKLYNDYFLDQLAVIKPFNPTLGVGLVDVPAGGAQITRENPVKWKHKIPTSQEIWNAQEDIWLVRSILDAIAETNGSADRIDKAPIRALLQLQLRGGDPETAPGGSAAGGMPGMGEPGMGGPGMGDYGGGFGMGGGLMGGGAMGGGTGATGVWSSFQGSLASDLLTEEFGPDPNAAAGGMLGMGGPGMGGPGMGGPGMDYGGGDYGGGDYGGGSTGGESSGEEGDGTADRYVTYGKDLPYKTRAFILKVKIIQKDIPTLLASLPNGKFPVEIVRVDSDFGGGGGGGGMPGGMSGMSGGGDYGGGDYGGGMGMSGGLSGGGGDYGGGDYGGGPGMGGPGMGGLTLGSGMGIGGGGLGTGNSGKPATRKERMQAKNGAGLFREAMMDKRLATVRIAGLMTIYQTREENAAEAESEDAAKVEAGESSDGLPAVAPDAASGESTEDATSPEVPAAGSAAVGAPDAGLPNASPNGGASLDAGGTPVPATGGSATGGSATEPAPDVGQPQASTQRVRSCWVRLAC